MTGASRDTLRPASADQLRQIIAEALPHRQALEFRGGGSKSQMGWPERRTTVVELGALSGVIEYDPGELVLTVGAGTRLCELESLVAEHQQMLAFEPFDHGPLYDMPPGESTIGGVIAANVCGSRRLSVGSARDHVLGFEAVSGRAELFKAGGRVVKNVTGFDLPRLMTGSWGRLAGLTAVTLKVMPRPQTELTVLIEGPTEVEGSVLMSRAVGSGAEVSAAAHLPPSLALAQAGVALRLEGFAPAVAARQALVRELVGDAWPVRTLAGDESAHLWQRICTAACLPRLDTLWRVLVPPAIGYEFVKRLGTGQHRYLYDWAGGLVWVAAAAELDVRSAATQVSGEAVLVRADLGVRTRIAALHPEPVALTALRARIKAAFDPADILDPGRFTRPVD